KPAVIGEQDVEVEEIVGGEGRADGAVTERSGPGPELVRRAGRDEQVDDPGAGRTVDGEVADRASEPVGARRDVVGADPDDQIVRSEERRVRKECRSRRATY